MKYFKTGMLFILLLSNAMPLLFSAEENKNVGGVLSHGVVFNIAKDRKIEKIGGIYEPEGIDKYVERKVNELSERMAKFEAQLDQTNSKLDLILKQLAASSSVTTTTPTARDTASK